MKKFLEKIGIKKVQLAEVPEEGTVSDTFFLRMMLPQAMKYAQPYEREEASNFSALLKKLDDNRKYHAVVIGAGTFFYIETLYKKTQSYTAVEPLSDLFIRKQFKFLANQLGNVFNVKKRFHQLKRKDLQEGHQLFFFIFNIFSYLNNSLKHINTLVQPGDIIILSTWRKTKKAKRVRKKYFDFLNDEEGVEVIRGDGKVALTNFDQFPVEKVKHYKEHKRMKGDVVDMLIIYT